MMRLNKDDGLAVDALLDPQIKSRHNGNAGGGGLPDRLVMRIEHVQSLLGLLHALPVGDPPDNLLAKTLEAIEKRPITRAAEPWPFAVISEPPDDLRPQI